jgi:hypothetical protein
MQANIQNRLKVKERFLAKLQVEFLKIFFLKCYIYIYIEVIVYRMLGEK